MRSIRQIMEQIPATLDVGLDPDGVAQSLVRFGPNQLTSLPREPLWRKFLEKFDEPIIKILLAAALLTIVVDLVKANPRVGCVALGTILVVSAVFFAVVRLRQWAAAVMFGMAIVLVITSVAVERPSYEGFAVMVAVLLATGVAFASEYKSDREFEVLNARKEEIQVKVKRDGAVMHISIEQLVVGDLVILETGDEVPADGRVLHAAGLELDQSLMTGESHPVGKRVTAIEDTADGPEHANCLYRGTQVIDGVGTMMTTEVGDETMLGQIARHLSSPSVEVTKDDRVRQKLTISKRLTPLQQKLAHLATLISRAGYLAAFAIFVALIVRGLLTGAFNRDWVDVIRYLLDSIMYVVIVIVVAVPEGLPMSVSISLALAMRKMTRANSLVRQLVACETIGSATVICTDKTGTLTQNRMQVDRLWWDGLTLDRGGAAWTKLASGAEWTNAAKPAYWIALNAAINSTANLEFGDDEHPRPIGNSTESALLIWLQENGVDYTELRSQFPTLDQIHFSSERKRMTSVIRHGNSDVALIKGAPEVIAKSCDRQMDGEGTIRIWDSNAQSRFNASLHESAGDALRTLAFGYKALPADTPLNDVDQHPELFESGFVFVGFVGIRDPLRNDAADAVRECRAAGIEVKMITGDERETARAIAKEAGILDSPDVVLLTHDEFEAMSDDRLASLMPRLRVLARARPLDKVRVVNILQSQNQVVAMTGDGANDAPALKQADVGLAMGITGTDVAKAASKIVLLDDSFATIVKAVNWGRSLYENIQRFLQFQLTINVSALTIAFIGPFLNVRPPFTILQLLWINVLMDTFASIALCSEAPRREVMRRPPKRRDENIVTRPMFVAIAATAAFFVVVMLLLLAGMKDWGWFASASGSEEASSSEFAPLTLRQVSIFFTVYVLFQVWNLINCRSLHSNRSALAGLWRNRTFLIIMSLTIIGQVLIITFGDDVFKVRPLGIVDWIVIVAGTSSVLIVSELVRLARRRTRRRIDSTGRASLN